jgi:hypothetical protein
MYLTPGRSLWNGRWVLRDRSLVDGPNLYGYVRGNPINNIDLTGQSSIAIAGGAAGGAVTGRVAAGGICAILALIEPTPIGEAILLCIVLGVACSGDRAREQAREEEDTGSGTRDDAVPEKSPTKPTDRVPWEDILTDPAQDAARDILDDKEPGKPWERRGGDDGNWYNPDTEESVRDVHEDEAHDRHVDYHRRGCRDDYRIYPDGTAERK